MAGADRSGQSKGDKEFTHVAVARLHRRSVLDYSGQHSHQSVSPRSVFLNGRIIFRVDIVSAMHGTFRYLSVLLSRADAVSSFQIEPRLSKL